jgi:hypothetical protein
MTSIYAQEARLSSTQRLLDVMLPNGDVYRCDLAALSPTLRLAHPSLVAQWQWIGPKAGIYWPVLDEDLSVASLVQYGQKIDTQTEPLLVDDTLTDKQLSENL